MATAPGSVTANLSTNTSITVSWSASSPSFGGSITYEVQRQTNFGNFLTVTSSTTLRSLTYTGLTPGNSYRFQVRSRETRTGFTTQFSSYTVSGRVYLPASAPSTVSLARVSGDTEAARASIDVSWTAMNGASGYDVERSENNGGYSRLVTGTQSTSLRSTGLNRGSTYQFRVRTNSTGGTSAFTTSGSLTLLPFRPASVTASLSGDTSIRVTWPAANGATSYRVQRSVNGGGYSDVETTTSRDRTYSSLNRGSTYTFRVWSINGGGESPTARESNSVLVPFPPPSTPPSATATKTKRDVRITYSASTAPAGTTILNYEIQISENNGSFGSTRTDNGGGETYSNLNPGSTYRGRVRAIGQGGASDWRESNSVTISARPTAPSNILLTRFSRNVFVELGTSTAASDVTISGYTIQRRESFNGGVTWADWGDQRSFNTTDRTTTYENLVAETTQQFRGRAESDFEASDWTTSEPFFIPGIPDPPSQVFALREGAAIFVIVAAPASDGGATILTYTVEKRISDDFGETWSDWGEEIIIPFLEPVYLYEGLELQKTYQFRALATNSEGDSEQFTESEAVYLPAIMKIYENNQFRLPNNYKRYSEEVGDWVGLSISQRYFGGEWFELE